MTLPKKADVVVVGAGPTGLTLACTLRAADLDVLVLDKVAEGANTSRAAVIHARTLEVLDELDITPRLVAEGCHRADLHRPRPSPRPRSAGLQRPAHPVPIHPDAAPISHRSDPGRTPRRAERPGPPALDRHLRGPTATGAVVTAADANGMPETVQARYVVGADGLNSVVRTSAGIGFTGDSYDASFVLADARLDWPLPTNEVQLFFAPAGLVVVAPLPGGRHRIVATLDQAPETPNAGLVQAVLDERGPGGAHVVDVAWSSRFRVQHRVADTYRNGALLLAGDAAHVHSPAGGQGMNTGIQDAVDLGHTLIDVLTGQAADTALDGYQQRRRPVAEQVVAADRPRHPAGHTPRTCATHRSQPRHVPRQPNPRGATTHRHPDRRTSKHQRRHRTHKKIRVRTLPGPHPVAMGA